MLVRDMISEIKNGQLSIDDLAKKYNFSDRTIQARIKELGFKWLAKEGKYDFVGDDESVFERDIDVVFESRTPSRSASKSKSKSNTTGINDIKDASNEVASTIQDAVNITPEANSNNASNDTSKKGSTRNSNKNSKKTAHNASGGASDNIDRLLAGKKAKKTYRGFYFDSDVLAVIEGVDSGIKSELINECLRKVFKEKGLL
jgi:hypothetical protein